MKILAVGGAGYVGSAVAHHLLRTGHKVVVLDDLSTGHRAAVPAGAIWVAGDLRDPLVADVLDNERPDCVMHFAARSLVGESMDDPLSYFDANVGGATALLRAIVPRRLPIIFSSTAAVYGHPETVPIAEDQPLAPVNPYGATKVVVEQLLDWCGELHGLRWMALRYFNAAGALGTCGEDHNPETHLIPIALQVVLGQRPELLIFGDDYPTADGTCIRDYIHVEDLAHAHRLAAESLAAGGEGGVLNVGGGQGRSVREVIDTVRRVTGHPVPARIAPRRAGDPPVLVASTGRAAARLGWRPVHDLAGIVESAWAWRQRFPRGYA